MARSLPGVGKSGRQGDSVHQRDYILRMIEQLGAVLVALRNRILGRDMDASQVRDELAGVAGRAGFDLELLKAFSLDTLVLFVAPTGEVEPGRCWIMAETLYLDGLQAHLEGRGASAAESLRKSRTLFSLIGPGGGMLIGFPEAAERIEEIERLLATAPDPEDETC